MAVKTRKKGGDDAEPAKTFVKKAPPLQDRGKERCCPKCGSAFIYWTDPERKRMRCERVSMRKGKWITTVCWEGRTKDAATRAEMSALFEKQRVSK